MLYSKASFCEMMVCYTE